MSVTSITFPNNVWKAYFFWVFCVSATFFFVYPLCNWIASQRLHVFSLYADTELNIPFVPEFVWAYISMNILFLLPPFFLDVPKLNLLGKQLVSATFFSGSIFLFFPAKLGFLRSVPEGAMYEVFFSKLFLVDMPYNLVPSLHVVFSAIIVLAITDISRTLLVKFAWWGWLVLICLSTLFVHQHHLLDLISGLLVAWLFRILSRKREDYANSRATN